MPKDLFEENGIEPKDLFSDNKISNQEQQSPDNSFLERAGTFAQQNINQPIQRNILGPLNRFSGGVEQSIANIPVGIANLGIHAVNALTGNQTKPYKSFQFVRPSPETIAGEIVPLLFGGSALKGISRIPEIGSALSNIKNIPEIGKILKAGGNAFQKIPKLIRNVGMGSLTGAVLQPENQTTGAIIGAGAGALPSVLSGIGKGINALHPANLFKGEMTKDELRNALAITQGTETPLGDVISSPFLKRHYENVLTKIPFSGATESLQRTGKMLVDRGESILSRLAGGHPTEDVGRVIQDALHQGFKDTLKEKQSLYKNVNILSEKQKLPLNLRRFSNLANKYSAAIEDSGMLKYEPDEASMLKKLVNYKEPTKTIVKRGLLVDKEGKPLSEQIIQKMPTLKEANLLKGKLNHYAELASASPDPAQRRIAGIFQSLSRSLKEDIVQSMEAQRKKSGSSDLIEAYKKAEAQYSQKFSPYLDKEMYKYAANKADPDLLLQAFLKTSKRTDRANLLNKLTSKLPPGKRDLMGYHLFSSAIKDGKLDPNRMATIYNNLGIRQREVLFPNKVMRQEIENYLNLVKKNPEATRTMFNPPTGQRLGEILPLGLAGAGYAKGGLTGAALGAVAPSLYGKAANYLLTNPKIRKKVVNKIMERK